MNYKNIVKLLRIRWANKQANDIAKAIVKYEKWLLTLWHLNIYCRELWYKYDLHK